MFKSKTKLGLAIVAIMIMAIIAGCGGNGVENGDNGYDTGDIIIDDIDIGSGIDIPLENASLVGAWEVRMEELGMAIRREFNADETGTMSMVQTEVSQPIVGEDDETAIDMSNIIDFYYDFTWTVEGNMVTMVVPQFDVTEEDEFQIISRDGQEILIINYVEYVRIR